MYSSQTHSATLITVKFNGRKFNYATVLVEIDQRPSAGIPMDRWRSRLRRGGFATRQRLSFELGISPASRSSRRSSHLRSERIGRHHRDLRAPRITGMPTGAANQKVEI
jgi:hypothetical protein